MKNINFIIVVISIIFILSLSVILPITYFYERWVFYVVDSPTNEQLETIIRGDADNGVFFIDAEPLYPGSSLIQVALRIRNRDIWKADRFISGIGIKYIKQKN